MTIIVVYATKGMIDTSQQARVQRAIKINVPRGVGDFFALVAAYSVGASAYAYIGGGLPVRLLRPTGT